MFKLCTLKKIFDICKRSYSDVPIMMNYMTYEPQGHVNELPPILMLHCAFCSKNYFHNLAKYLTYYTSRRIYTLDVRNHGSSAHTPEHTYEHLVADVLEFMDNLDIHEIIAIGHGMGGLVMSALAMLYPSSVERLVVLDVSPIGIPRTVSKGTHILKAMLTTEIPKELTLEDARALMLPIIDNILNDELYSTLIVQNLRKDPNGAFSWGINRHALLSNWKELSKFPKLAAGLSPYTRPTLLIASETSMLVSLDHIPEIKKKFPKCNIKWVNTGHMLHLENPKKVSKFITDFTKEMK